MQLITLSAQDDSGGLFIIITVLEVRKLKPRLMKHFGLGHRLLSGGAGITGHVRYLGFCPLLYFGQLQVVQMEPGHCGGKSEKT